MNEELNEEPTTTEQDEEPKSRDLSTTVNTETEQTVINETHSKRVRRPPA